ncbi:Bro-N domain-containing protein [Saccharopolyspora sp. 5N102]|uniref:Bro-N domain-containing protein n=1 Tax=Saccharopolyspora sp. 5N102 TaxID=3375155 RepID=UPI003792867E
MCFTDRDHVGRCRQQNGLAGRRRQQKNGVARAANTRDPVQESGLARAANTCLARLLQRQLLGGADVPAILPFDFGDHQMRFGLDEAGHPYVVAADFAKALGYRSANDALRLIDDDEKGTQIVRTLGGDQRFSVLYEDGIWELIFLSRRPAAKALKKRVKEILREIRKRGFHISPNPTDAQLIDLQDELARRQRERAAVSEARMRALNAARGVVDSGYLDQLGRIELSWMLGTQPELDPEAKPLTVSIYLSKDRGLTAAQCRKLAPAMGKQVKRFYVEKCGENPPVIEDVVGRHTVTVAQYQERHRPLFDAAWELLRDRLPNAA